MVCPGTQGSSGRKRLGLVDLQEPATFCNKDPEEVCCFVFSLLIGGGAAALLGRTRSAGATSARGPRICGPVTVATAGRTLPCTFTGSPDEKGRTYMTAGRRAARVRLRHSLHHEPYRLLQTLLVLAVLSVGTSGNSGLDRRRPMVEEPGEEGNEGCAAYLQVPKAR